MTQVWARSVAAGMDDAVFWGSTPAETAELATELRTRHEAEVRAANQRAGLVAAQIVNLAGKTSKKTVRAEDFFRDPGASKPAEDPGAKVTRKALLMWGEMTRGVTIQ